jgi:hypothetical protein
MSDTAQTARNNKSDLGIVACLGGMLVFVPYVYRRDILVALCVLMGVWLSFRASTWSGRIAVVVAGFGISLCNIRVGFFVGSLLF